jgi:hypothetical protein
MLSASALASRPQNLAVQEARRLNIRVLKEYSSGGRIFITPVQSAGDACAQVSETVSCVICCSSAYAREIEEISINQSIVGKWPRIPRYAG